MLRVFFYFSEFGIAMVVMDAGLCTKNVEVKDGVATALCDVFTSTRMHV